MEADRLTAGANQKRRNKIHAVQLYSQFVNYIQDDGHCVSLLSLLCAKREEIKEEEEYI